MLALAAGGAVFALALHARARDAQRTDDMISLVNAIRQSVARLYGGAVLTGAVTPSVDSVVGLHLVDAKFTPPGTSGVLVNPWGSALSFAATAGVPGYALSLGTMPTRACIAVLGALGVDAELSSLNFGQSMTIGQPEVVSASWLGAPLQLTPNQINTACQTSSAASQPLSLNWLDFKPSGQMTTWGGAVPTTNPDGSSQDVPVAIEVENKMTGSETANQDAAPVITAVPGAQVITVANADLGGTVAAGATAPDDDSNPANLPARAFNGATNSATVDLTAPAGNSFTTIGLGMSDYVTSGPNAYAIVSVTVDNPATNQALYSGYYEATNGGAATWLTPAPPATLSGCPCQSLAVSYGGLAGVFAPNANAMGGQSASLGGFSVYAYTLH